MKLTRTLLMLAFAFGAGAFASRLLPETARAAAAPVAPMSMDLNTLTAADFPPPNPVLPNVHTKNLTQVESTTVQYTMLSSAPKHTHAGTTEVQLVMAGSGTEWLGDKQVPIAPGTVVVVPPNTVHSGFTGGPFRLYVIKTPPQDPSDVHVVQ